MPELGVKKTVLIAGPTASGKSAAALSLAEKFGGTVVNADALQVYRDLQIITARPGPEETARAPHFLYGHIDGEVRYSAGEWLRDAVGAIGKIHAAGQLAIIVGGTGLYFRALEYGLSQAPRVPEEVRQAAATRLEEVGVEAFRAEVLAFDPDMARLDRSDRQRHLRAWAVYHASGERLSDIQKKPASPGLKAVHARIVIEPPREALYETIERRFLTMIAGGALEETAALHARRLDRSLPVMKAVGAAELMRHLDGEISLDEAVDLAKRNSRRFAKRQLTWFRHQAASWPRAVSAEMAVEAATGQAFAC